MHALKFCATTTAPGSGLAGAGVGEEEEASTTAMTI
jgi:hypothetical protein